MIVDFGPHLVWFKNEVWKVIAMNVGMLFMIYLYAVRA